MSAAPRELPPISEPPTELDRSDVPDDPRLVRAVQQYLEELEAGHRPDRQEFVRRYPEFQDALAQCLDGLELVHAAGLRSKAPATDAAAGLFGPGELLPSSPLGDFQIVREIGRGGMGVVYEAVQLSLGRRVALKVLPFAAAYDAKQLQRFQTEAQAAAQLHHTNIVPVFAISKDRGLHFYAMQLIDGHSLAALISQLRTQRKEQKQPVHPEPAAESSTLAATLTTQRAGRPGEYYRTICRLIVQAAGALDHAHQFGIIHRDIKPANLLLDQRGTLWVTDFGLAQVQSDVGLTQSGDLLGTLRYMSPEQAAGQRSLLDHRTDIYSLGATLYELTTLAPIFDGRNRHALLHQILQYEPRPPRAIDKGIPVELETIILKAVSKHPHERYATAQALADDVRRFLDDKPILARRPTLFDRMRKWSRRHPSVVGAAVALLLLCIAGLVINNQMIADEQAKTARRAEEAEARFQLARRSVDEMIRIANEELADNPGQQTLRRRLLEAALEYYQEFIELRRDDPAAQTAQAELETTRDRVKTIVSDLAVLQGAWQHVLLRESAVQDDLKLSAEQREQLRDALKDIGAHRLEPPGGFQGLTAEERANRLLAEVKVHEAAIAAILTRAQLVRLQQIALQARGPLAFREPNVVSALKLTPAQRERIRAIEADMFHGPAGLKPAARPPGPPGPARGEFEAVRAEALHQILSLFTDEQVKSWQTLVGEPFQGPLPVFITGPPRGFGPPPPGPP